MPRAKAPPCKAGIEMTFSFGVARRAGQLKVLLPSFRRGEEAPKATEGGQGDDDWQL